jgi:uncharacterized protein
MGIDIHCHVAGNGTNLDNVNNDVFFKPKDNNHWFTRILYNMMTSSAAKLGGDPNKNGVVETQEYFDFIYKLFIKSNEIDGIVLLALDGLYSPETHELDGVKTDLWVSNRFLSGKIKELNEKISKEPDEKNRKKRFYFGASVNPNRKDKDLQDELDFVFSKTDAVLMKLIPSTQHIDLACSRHKSYFERLAQEKIPLLCHTGPEYTFPEGIRNQELDFYHLLENPLNHGLKVIAAHCATPVFPVIDHNWIKEFHGFMKNANAGGMCLWADTSALSLSTRIFYLPWIVEHFDPAWLIHGTDFPIPIDGWVHLPLVTHDMRWKEYSRIINTKNPFDKDVLIKRAHGFENSILENAESVLRLP